MKNEGNIKIPLLVIIAIFIIILVIVSAIVLKVINNKQNKKEILNEEIIKNNEEQQIEIEDYSNYDEGVVNKELPKIEVGIIAQENSTIDGKIPSFYNPVIPEGFKAITAEQDNTIKEEANWVEQNSYLYGLVIQDNNQNQFVWVPVENIEIFKTTDWKQNIATNELNANYVEPQEINKDEYYKMYYKVKKYGGFYIGRYETGDVDSTSERLETKNSDNIGIRKNLIPYNYVPFELSTINKKEIIGAKELATKFAQINEYKTAKSTLTYGTQWDSILRFIASDENNVNDSTAWGNYPISTINYKDIYGNEYTKQSNEDVYLLRTGASEQTKVKNIYDIAGNLSEWTMESTKSNAKIVRGGSYVSTIGQLAATRYAYKSSEVNNNVGFRISLYVN